jgi:DNA processing protein
MAEELPAEKRALLTLHLVPGLGPKLTMALLARFGSAAAILRASSAELQHIPYLGAEVAQAITRAFREIDVDAELRRMEEHRVRALILGESEYPACLNDIPARPHLLYLRGELRPGDAQAIAIVGSRHCTSYGRRMAEKLAFELVRSGFAIISGLARGIDGMAHRAALDAHGRTIAVLAGGLARIYPPEHTDLAREIEAAGALLSEAPMLMEPMAGMFPARNRLISGLARGVVIVEAAARSGALITASHAAEQGRPVFAVPGPLDSPASAGSHALLRQGAILLRGVEDILEELEGVRPIVAPAEVKKPENLDDAQARIWESLDGGSRHVDELVQTLALPVSQVTSSLLMLEMRKLVRRLPGNQYERNS